MKGIILAGGTGTRLHPLTYAVSKQLMPVYDKPMIYYPLSTLMAGGISDILIITTSKDSESFKTLLGDGSQLGISISYQTQDSPDGIAQAFIIGESFIDGDACSLILGDNLFHDDRLGELVEKAAASESGASIFASQVKDPQRYGVVDFDENNIATSVEEKPEVPKSNWAITGLYFYDNEVIDMAKSLSPSDRGELEITDLNRLYLEAGNLNVTCLGRGVAWLDTGTFDSMVSATEFVRVLEQRQQMKIGCIEEVAWKQGWIDSKQLGKLAIPLEKSGYGLYLKELIENQ